MFHLYRSIGMIRMIKYIGRKLALHGLFWTGVLLFYTFFFGLEEANFTSVLSFSVFLLPVTISTTYVFIYFLIPKYLLHDRISAFVFYSIAAFVISSTFIILSAFYGLFLTAQFSIETNFVLKKSLLFIHIAVYLVCTVAIAFSLLKQNYRARDMNEKLKNRLLEGELQLKTQELHYLKMQIHPHFLFNTLNTLYGFALKKREETPELILKLSNLLDYILYHAQKDKVSLQQEIEHIQDYIALEKMRFKDKLEITTQWDPIPEDLEIAPMIFLPFIENSFKHGKLKDGKLKVKMAMRIVDHQIYFQLRNEKVDSTDAGLETQIKEPAGGIGLKNLRKRLDLIYPNAHTITIDNKPDFFEVSLVLKMNYV